MAPTRLVQYSSLKRADYRVTAEHLATSSHAIYARCSPRVRGLAGLQVTTTAKVLALTYKLISHDPGRQRE